MTMDIVKQVAEAIDVIPGKPSSLEVARIAIEEYQKALWTPLFNQENRFGFVPELRRHHAYALTAHIMNAIGKYLDRGEVDGARKASRDLFEAIYEAGAYIVTDADRAGAGLPMRGPYGLTREELRILEHKHIEAMMSLRPPLALDRFANFVMIP
jgi:hypothetical protein